MAVYTGLGYPESNETEAYDLFAVDGTGNTFATFKLEGGLCGLIGTVTVEATGSEIGTVKGEAINKKCGLAAQVGEITAGNAFAKTASGAEVVKGGLNFPGGAGLITKARLDEGTGLVLKTCKLEAIIVGSREKAEEIGLSEVKTSPEEAFGWEK